MERNQQQDFKASLMEFMNKSSIRASDKFLQTASASNIKTRKAKG
jgi:hypothetical protein